MLTHEEEDGFSRHQSTSHDDDDHGHNVAFLSSATTVTIKPKQKTTRLQACSMLASHILSSALIVTTIVWVNRPELGGGGVSLSDDYPKITFNAHPLCMLMSFVMMTVAILSFRLPYLTSNISHFTIKVIHASAWLIAIVSSCIGIYAVFKSHNHTGIEGKFIANLYSLHSWIGIGTFSLFLAQFVAGALAFGISPDSRFRMFGNVMRAKLMPYHQVVGKLVYFGWAGTILMGLQDKEGFIGCGYNVEKMDVNPIEHFKDIPVVCRISHSIGLIVCGIVVTTVIAMTDMRNDKDLKAESERE